MYSALVLLFRRYGERQILTYLKNDTYTSGLCMIRHRRESFDQKCYF